MTQLDDCKCFLCAKLRAGLDVCDSDVPRDLAHGCLRSRAYKRRYTRDTLWRERSIRRDNAGRLMEEAARELELHAR